MRSPNGSGISQISIRYMATRYRPTRVHYPVRCSESPKPISIDLTRKWTIWTIPPVLIQLGLCIGSHVLSVYSLQYSGFSMAFGFRSHLAVTQKRIPWERPAVPCRTVYIHSDRTILLRFGFSTSCKFALPLDWELPFAVLSRMVAVVYSKPKGANR
jgi:hypothetical protein